MAYPERSGNSTLALRRVFSPEPLPARTHETLRRSWFSESIYSSFYAPFVAGEVCVPSVIKKPSGMVTEVSKGGYSLKQKLQWSEVVYKEVHVSSIH